MELDRAVGSGSQSAVGIRNVDFGQQCPCAGLQRIGDSGDRSRKLAIGEFLDRAFPDPAARFDDSHFDELLPRGTPVPRGDELIRCSCELLEDLLPKVRARKKFADVRHVGVLLRLPISERIELWEPGHWSQLDAAVESPDLVLMKFDFYRAVGVEVYYRRLEVPVRGYPHVSAVYTSFLFLEKFNEYANGIHLIADV